MNTWNCKGVLAGAALTALAACEDGQGGGLFDAAATPPDAVPLSEAKMAFGAVTLVPPRGYCIDKATLRQNFALMVPCAKLGARAAATDAPAGLLTASFAALRDGSAPTAQEIATAHQLEEIAGISDRDGTVTFSATGPVPAKGYSSRHWRGSGTIGTQVLSVALFGAPGARATGSEGRSLIHAMFAATAKAS